MNRTWQKVILVILVVAHYSEGGVFCFHHTRVPSVTQVPRAVASCPKSLDTEEGIKKEKKVFSGRASQVSMTKSTH